MIRAKDRIRIALTVVVSCTGMAIGNVLIVIAKSISVRMTTMVLSKVKLALGSGTRKLHEG